MPGQRPQAAINAQRSPIMAVPNTSGERVSPCADSSTQPADLGARRVSEGNTAPSAFDVHNSAADAGTAANVSANPAPTPAPPRRSGRGRKTATAKTQDASQEGGVSEA